MALRKENHGEGEETSKRKHKTSLKTEKPSNSSKEKNPDQKCQGALEICTHRKHALQGSPGVTSVQKLVIGCKLVKVHNQENYLKLLKKKNLSSQEKSWTLVKSKATPQSHYGLQPFLWKPVNFKLDSVADVTVFPYNTFLNTDLQIQYNLSLLIKCFWVHAILGWTVRENSQLLSLTTKLQYRKLCML